MVNAIIECSVRILSVLRECCMTMLNAVVELCVGVFSVLNECCVVLRCQCYAFIYCIYIYMQHQRGPKGHSISMYYLPYMDMLASNY